MKKRAKQLAMLGLTVTMMCGTQMTAFASGLGEEAPVAIETEAKATANEETEEEVKTEAKEEKADAKEEVKTEIADVVTGTEVAETPVVEETEVKETVAGTDELVGLGVSTEAEAETDADTVPAPAPQTDVEANADTNTEVEEQADAEVTGSITGVTFGGAVDGVITLTDKDFITEDFGSYANIPITVSTSSSEGTFGIESTNSGFGLINPQDFDGDGVFTGEATVIKEDLIEAGGTKTFTGTLEMSSYKDGRFDKVVDTADFSVTVKYVADGTVTPEPEKPQPEPEKPDLEKDGWIKTDEGWKYYENGQKVTGWKAVSEKWYYFNENGIMETGWASVGGHWYYLNADGSMATGWVSVGGHWYYLNTDGTMATGWASVGGHWYYLNEDGTMASNQWIDGWYVDASGKML